MSASLLGRITRNARLPAPLIEWNDDAGSAVHNASRSAAGSAGPFLRRIEQQVGEQRHRLAALLIAQPRKARLQQLDLGSLTQFIRDRQRSQASNELRGRSGSHRTLPLQRSPFDPRKVTGRNGPSI